MNKRVSGTPLNKPYHDKSQLQYNDNRPKSFLKITVPLMPLSYKKVPLRLVIYASDVERITGRSPRTSRKILQEIRKKHNKSKEAFVTIAEFSAYSGISEEAIRNFLES